MEAAEKPAESQERDHIVPRIIEQEMKQSYLDYAMSVIVGRALPDVRDGLKPVHRRILFAMREAGQLHNKPYKKSAHIVGKVLGELHPHGDAAVYDTMVRMAQNFSLRYPLMDGHGNWGSIDGDSAAAYRYTEVRLKKIAEELLADIEKDTVDFQPNFDGSLKEPTVLPGKLPNLLINGSSGIAVGMATNIPPHNISEVIDGTIALIENPSLTIPELMQFIKAPDFPTGAHIVGMAGIHEAYETGHGKAIMKAKSEIIELKGRNAIIVSEIPYMINKSQLIEEIAAMVRDKRIMGVSDIRDESNKEGIRVVFELKKDAQPKVVLNQLHTFSRLTSTFGINMLALVNNEPVVLNLKQLVQHHITYRQIVVRRRTAFELRKAEERKHVLEGLIIALNHIDEVVRKIKASKTVEDAQFMLIQDYTLTEIQAKAILDLRLQKLASLEQEKIKQEHSELLKTIAHLESILASEPKIFAIIKEELMKLREEYGDGRRTIIEHAEGEDDMPVEALIKKEEVVVTISHKGYVKRTPLTEYRSQARGGIGVKAAETGDDDYVQDLFTASTHSYLLAFTNQGRVYWLKVHELPEASRQARGKAFVNLIQFQQNEKVNAVVPVTEFDDQHFVVLATKQGTIKKTNLSEFSRPRANGIAAITLDGDELVNVLLTDGKQQLLIATANGNAVRFDETDVRSMGRTASGVRGIELRDNDGKIVDSVIDLILVDEKKTVLTITENGYGKRTAVDEYRLTRRGGSGVINIQTSERNGKVVAVDSVTDEDEVIVISQDGTMIRIPCKDISTIGRNTQGVRVMKLREGDKVVSATKVARE
ncbi:MAG: DNA gyrase subunit A [Candidatus Woesearchaeota archaeon]|nr:DNA gyrase subunit A [Candidatus Woesearchaeota archaeon]